MDGKTIKGYPYSFQLCATHSTAISVLRPYVKPNFSEPGSSINTKFCAKVSVHHISRPFVSGFEIVNFVIFTTVFFFHFR